MSTIKCSGCSLINFATAQFCKRCNAELNQPSSPRVQNETQILNPINNTHIRQTPQNQQNEPNQAFYQNNQQNYYQPNEAQYSQQPQSYDYSLPQILTPTFISQKTNPINTPNTKGFMSVAQRKESEAKTNGDFYQAALEWQKAEEYYTKAESLAATDEERESAKRDKDICIQRKLYTLKRSEAKEKNKY